MANCAVLHRFTFAVVLLLLCSTQVCGDLLQIAHAPNYVQFFERPSEDLATSNIPKMISHSLGLPSGAMNWNGMLQGSLFKKPKANVMVTIIGYDGMDRLPVAPKTIAKYTVQNDVPFVDFNQVISSLLRSSFGSNPLMVELLTDKELVDVKSEHKAFKNMLSTRSKLADRLFDKDSVNNLFDIGTMNISNSSDAILLAELQMILDVMNKLKTNPSYLKSKTPDFFSFTVTGLEKMADQHGRQSSQIVSATKLLNSFVDKMTSEFRTLYNDGVIVELLTTQPIHGELVRKTRSLMQAQDIRNQTNLNLVGDYSDDYASIFNIILWGMIVLSIVIFIICFGIWNMDPGRDSVIYRMTSQRLKKD